MGNDAVTVPIEGRRVRLTNLDKVLYPRSGFTKGEVIDHARRIAPVLLPHLARKPVTRVRCPDGIDAPGTFFEKHWPRGAPDWLTAGVVTGSDGPITYPVVDALPALIVLANLAALELHVPQWHLPPEGAADLTDPAHAPLLDTVVIDLDPDPELRFDRVVLAAQLAGGQLTIDGLEPWVRSSGGTGLQVYAAIEPAPAQRVVEYCRLLAARLGEVQPALFTTSVAKRARVGRVLVDINQNQPGRTMIAPYSLRAREVPRGPTVATPLAWEELEGVTDRRSILFTPDDVVERVERLGDLAAALLPDAPRNALPERP